MMANVVPPLPPSIKSASFVGMVETDDAVGDVIHVVVHGANFNQHFTKMYFDPPVGDYKIAQSNVSRHVLCYY